MYAACMGTRNTAVQRLPIQPAADARIGGLLLFWNLPLRLWQQQAVGDWILQTLFIPLLQKCREMRKFNFGKGWNFLPCIFSLFLVLFFSRMHFTFDCDVGKKAFEYIMVALIIWNDPYLFSILQEIVHVLLFSYQGQCPVTAPSLKLLSIFKLRFPFTFISPNFLLKLTPDDRH